MTLFSEGIASHHLLLQLIKQLEENGQLTPDQVEEVLHKATENAVKELRGAENSSERDSFQEVVISSAKRAIEILKNDRDVLREARAHK